MLLFTFIMDDEPKRSNTKEIQIDENLFKRIGNNDMEALEELYHLTERTLYAYLLSIVKNHDETLDLMQETYIKIMSSAHLYKPMGKPLAWIFTVAKNLYLSRLRKNKRVIDMDSVELFDDLRFSYITDPDDKIVLESAFDILDEEERQIIFLYAVSGLKHREIAESIGLKLSTTLSKYHRALKKLRNHLTEGGVGYEG
ncbi:MAG: RNA polymerase sigma factor [Tissierellia bacterium]|nr:RNA polymerase sigma factor [Tissierellia bacterium]MDD4725513.1 RNA polymerase sigma factor [Tissierellia bacterium]